MGAVIGGGPDTYAVKPYYKMWFTDGTVGGQIGFSYSRDGVNWSTCAACVCAGLTNPHHVAVVYTGSKYRIWYWDTAVLYAQAAIRSAKSSDGLNWSGDQVTTGSLITGISPDWNRGSYGPCQVFYNPTAANSGTDPFNYSFYMYFDGTTGGLEETGLGYSADGIDWQLYGRVLARGNSGPGGNTDDWDSSYASRCSVVKVSAGEWHMWYSGGQTGLNEGIGHAVSTDGLNWSRNPDNPILHVSDGETYRDSRTYTPWVLHREDRFQGNGDSIKFKGWFTSRGSSGLKTICHLGTNLLADLSLNKSVDTANAGVGDNIYFTIIVTNNGVIDASGVQVTEFLPVGLTFISAAISGGAYDDAAGIWDVGSLSVNTSATLQITARIDRSGSLANTAELTACDQLDPDSDPGDNEPGEDDHDSAEITADTPPTADAGKDRAVCVGDEVVLDGTASNDPDGDAVEYSWRFVSLPTGSNAELHRIRAAAPYFTPDTAGYFRLRLDVTDPDPVGLTASDYVTVTAEICNQQPVAIISGQSEVCGLPRIVELSGETSYDPDGQILEYSWEILKKPSSSTAQLSSAKSVKTSFIADLPGVYSIALRVKDDGDSWSNLTTKPAAAHIGDAPRMVVKGNRVRERAWLMGRDYFNIAVEMSPSPCEMPIEKYFVYRKAGAGELVLIKELTGVDFSPRGTVYVYEFTDKFFDSGRVYTYRAAAVDKNGVIVSFGEEIF
ncbi:MAG: DUF11 domain-containing protein [Candidatus Aminicenantes bacterium]|nr:DUF11 domain-containing protein [Candidatus Aminicenantes bacterium]